MNTHARTIVELGSLVTLALALACPACATPADAGEIAEPRSSELSTTEGLPAGHFEGSGRFVDADGRTYPYHASTTTSANAVELAWGPNGGAPDGSVKMNLTWRSPVTFAFGLSESDPEIGTGYCIDERCHFSVVSGGEVWFEMTLDFTGDRLTSLGSKGPASQRVYWGETLEKR
jgi:hypothetical protein